VSVESPNTWVRRLTGEEAATATEYAVMLALILLVCIAAIAQYGLNLGNQYNTIDGTLFP